MFSFPRGPVNRPYAVPYRNPFWIPEGKDVALGRNELTIANLLKQQGYDTAMMGKLHLNAGGDRTDQPQAKDMGFDYTLVNPAGFVTDATLDNAKERPRYGVVHPTGGFVMANILAAQIR